MRNLRKLKVNRNPSTSFVFPTLYEHTLHKAPQTKKTKKPGTTNAHVIDRVNDHCYYHKLLLFCLIIWMIGEQVRVNYKQCNEAKSFEKQNRIIFNFLMQKIDRKTRLTHATRKIDKINYSKEKISLNSITFY